VLSGEAATIIFIVFGFTRSELEPTVYRTEASTLTIKKQISSLSHRNVTFSRHNITEKLQIKQQTPPYKPQLDTNRSDDVMISVLASVR
jgi:hypothetical protein